MTWDRVCQTIDDAASDFKNLDSPTTHVARLIFQFDFGNSKSVDCDIRRVHFAPILDRYDGTLTYPAPEDYPVTPEPSEWSPHPSGIRLAWEGEYIFAEPVRVPELQQITRQSYNTSLRLDWPTRLPEVEIEDVPCRFAMTTRFF